MRADLDTLEAAIGHAFGSRDLLVRALTHTSHAYERSQPPIQDTPIQDRPFQDPPFQDNEQLEFLGDSILGFLVSESLVCRYPAYREGRLSILKNYLVSASHLHEVARKIGLGEYLLLGRGEELSGGRVKKGLLADAVEALIAAIYLDAGIGQARQFVVGHILGAAQELEDNKDAPFTNFKGAVQEVARSLNLPSPRYTVVQENGPPHARQFTVEVAIGADLAAQADGDSKKSAGQKAAQLLLQRLMEHAE